MGNRAFIAAAPYEHSDVGIYVHWNGGRESVEAFCQAAKELGFRDPDDDRWYALARLTQLIANFFGNDGLSVGIGTGAQLASAGDDQGVWVIGKNWKVVEHRDCRGKNPTKLFPLTAVQTAKVKEIRDEVIKRTRLVDPPKEEDKEDAKVGA